METAQESLQNSTKIVETIEVPAPVKAPSAPKGKGGPKPKASQESVDDIVSRLLEIERQLAGILNRGVSTSVVTIDPIVPMEKRVDQLTAALEKIATYSGHANHLHEFGLKRWTPEAKDMTKHHDG